MGDGEGAGGRGAGKAGGGTARHLRDAAYRPHPSCTSNNHNGRLLGKAFGNRAASGSIQQ
jgi:hypothetical protein